MTQFSANLGFLWADRPLPDAIRAAKAAGFDAVECHWPYDIPAAETLTALQETGLPMLGLNTRRGDVAGGENGLSALPGREADAQVAITQAVDYATAIGAGAIHVMAGFSRGPRGHKTFLRNLEFATKTAGAKTILIEPLNRHDAPGYFLQTTDQAREIIAELAAPNLKLMFDCYHVGRTEGDVITRLTDLLPIIGHIQFASVPDRGRPDHGELNYAGIFAAIADLGWDAPLGAEYKPGGPTDATLEWMSDLR
ncbi:hydroxypyruvate isomerase family protein [Actibacterium sp. 188UL27-1]|uniref:hydroxypyruvate isomerase family protein n=1 Tax=Actibacterium sp. 188UL27-1 TaxID=2786961 RepID=UPI00195A8A85|nr:TIM barrel protein [Actibacterium sp. 188UL27-1]MBM7069386.1 TIM barrel protein [Actibacterium sp. 188UL27-1]